MALDRSYDETTNVMTAKGKLRKFDILDNDWDFNCRELGNFMDGTDGEALDRKVLVVKCSDLLSKWVGESEQNIASAFRRAEAEHALLFFDEVDGLVQSRDNAHASWEVT